jgi:hypothetical protein
MVHSGKRYESIATWVAACRQRSRFNRLDGDRPLARALLVTI